MKVDDFYNDFYSKALESRSHAKFCTEVYGLNLCQHGMADIGQIDLMIQAAGIGKNSHVLDLGCGPGLITEYIQKKTGCSILGIDISVRAIAYADRNIDKANGRIQFATGDMTALSLEENQFDAVLLIDTHYFIDDFLKYIPAFLKYLTPDGKLVIFSDQGKGITAYDEKDTQPEETIIGEFLGKNGLKYSGIGLFDENQRHWKLKKAVLDGMKKEFEDEGNAALHESRLKECTDTDRTLDGRYLFLIDKA